MVGGGIGDWRSGALGGLSPVLWTSLRRHESRRRPGFTRQLVQTSATGTDNVVQRTGVPFATLAKRWVLANWVSDLPGFAAPSNLKYKTWAFRSAYPTLHASCTAALPATFPLVAPGGPGAAINVTGTIYAGSAGTYQRALQAPGDGQFTLLFSDGTGALLQGSVLPRLNVIRIR